MIQLFRSLFAPPRHLILVLAALWIGLVLTEKRAARDKISKEAINNLVFFSLIAYVLGGRILFVVSNLPSFSGNLLSVFSPNIDLFDPAGALAAAVMAGCIYGQRRRLPVWSTLDALTPLFAALAVGLSLSHLAAGTAFGRPADIPWGMQLWNASRHPTQIYQLIASLAILAFIWLRISDSPAGTEFLLFIALSAGTRLFLEAFRGDSPLVLGGLRLAQILAWLILAGSLLALDRIQRTKKPAGPSQENMD
jgi:phosphatidylglycerol---prolipoprotein diacylglyceryl transferase